MIFGDNRGALALTWDLNNHGKSKHIDVPFHYVRELVANHSVVLEYVQSTDNIADFLTKPMQTMMLIGKGYSADKQIRLVPAKGIILPKHVSDCNFRHEFVTLS